MLRQFIKYLQFYISARFPGQVEAGDMELLRSLFNRPGSPEGAAIEALRKEQARSREELSITDFGAGYGGNRQTHIRKTLSQVVKSSARGRKEGELLKGLAEFIGAEKILELGTNLGYSAMYLRAGAPRSELISIEGAESLHELAKENFAQMNREADLRCGTFSEELESGINWKEFAPDLVLLDGDHRYEPTLKYVDFILPKMSGTGVLIMDDIYWSAGMEKAWNEVRNRPEFGLTFDLFSLGICFKGMKWPQRHYKFRYFP